jgi:hypothetical protein
MAEKHQLRNLPKNSLLAEKDVGFKVFLKSSLFGGATDYNNYAQPPFAD